MKLLVAVLAGILALAVVITAVRGDPRRANKGGAAVTPSAPCPPLTRSFCAFDRYLAVAGCVKKSACIPSLWRGRITVVMAVTEDTRPPALGGEVRRGRMRRRPRWWRPGFAYAAALVVGTALGALLAILILI